MPLRRQPPLPDGHELLDAAFLLATVEHGPDVHGHALEQDLKATVRSLDEPERHVLPLFTSEDVLDEIYPQGSTWVRLPLPDILRLFADGDWDAAIVDPGQADARELSREEIEQLLAHADGA